MPIRIILVDDHPLFLEGLKFIVGQEPRLRLVGTVSDGASLLAFIQDCPFDVILMDINMPGLNGIEATRLIREQRSDGKIIAITMLDDYGSIRQMMRAGADGYLLKNAGAPEILNAIYAVMNNETYYSPEVQQVLMSKALGEEPKRTTLASTRPEELLTKREWEVLRLIAEGLTNHEIAERLFVSESTAITHRKNILHKFGQKNTASLIRYVLDNHLLDV